MNNNTNSPGVGARSVWFVVPAYNESMSIGRVVRALVPHGRVVVIDDASQDRTGLEASDAGAHVLTMPINRGQGAALQTGFDYVLNEGASHVVTFDADGQHSIEDALRMVARLDAEALDVVLGSRFLGRTVNMPLSRRLILKLAVAFTRLTTGLRLTDTHNGLRALSRQAALRVRLTQDRMAHASEFLNIIAAEKLEFDEEPVTITYTAQSLRKGQRLRNSIGVLEELAIGHLLR